MKDMNLFSKIETLVFDVDGVFTDTRIMISENGEFLRTMNTRDGYAIKLAKRAGINMAVITGGTGMGAENRLKDVGIDLMYSGVLDKKPVLEKLISDQGWRSETLLYIGDELPGIPCIMMAGVGACPSGALPEVKAVPDYISPKKGGDFC